MSLLRDEAASVGGGLWPFQPRSATSLARGRMGALLLYSATIGLLLGGRPLLPPAPAIQCCATPTPTTTTSTSDALELHSRLVAAAEEDTPLGRAVGHGLQVLKDAFRLYGADRVVSSFNGGKDAVAILHLCRAALAAHDETARLRVIFFEVDDEFPEIDAFVRESVKKHDLDLVAMSGVGFAEGLGQCIAMHDSKAFVLGTREADPNAGGQQDFAPSSDWMPPFMRVNPILTWGYHDVWDFLRTFDLDYCALYDDGYTSLGKQASTNRNPALKRPDGSYAPAWLLKDESLERAGRIATKKPSSAAAAILSKSGTNDSDGAATADEEDETEACEEDRLRVESAALLIVGDEILGGKQQDLNMYVAAKSLRRAGVPLKRVAVVPDEMGDIVDHLKTLTRTFDVVITSGGLGPTHDDITMKAVSEALGMEMVRSEEMASLIASRYEEAGQPLPSEVVDKMSDLPSGVRIRMCKNDPEGWPILQCDNVFVLPGVPKYFDEKLSAILDEFCVATKPPTRTKQVRLRVNEEAIVSALNKAVASHPQVTFGSYPVRDQPGEVKAVITLEADGGEAGCALMTAAVDALLASLPEEGVVEVSESLEIGECE